MIDSGCTDHMTNTLSDYSEYTDFATPSTATLADTAKTRIQTLGSGTINGTTFVNGKKQPIRLEHVLYCPSVSGRLLSIRCLTNKGLKVEFLAHTTHISRNGSLHGIGHLKNRQWYMVITPEPSVHAVRHADTPIDIAHQRFGHLNWEALQHLRSAAPPVRGLSLSDAPRSTHPCEGCQLGKQARRPFPPSSTDRATSRFDLIHSNLAGPMQTKSLSGKSYIVTYIDDYSDTT